MGTVYRRGRIWWIKYYRHGKPFRESTKSLRVSDARRLLRRREGEIATGHALAKERLSFEELAEDFLDDYRANNRKSLRWAERRLQQHLTPFFGGLQAIDITTDVVRGYVVSRRQEGASNGSINRELAALKRILNLAARTTPPKLARVPHIRMLRESNVRTGFFEHSDYCALRRELPSYLRPVLIFGYYTGARLGEVLSLKWCQVDLGHAIVHLDPGTTKNDQPRTIPLTQQVLKALRAIHRAKNQNSERVFTRRGKPIRTFYVAWKSACERAGIGQKLFHDLRRTAVRNMVRAGVPERVAMVISGHKTRSIFDRYNIVSERDLQLASRRLEAHLTGSTHR